MTGGRFEDEVREGFYISGMMKRYRAAQMVILSEIDNICTRHNLRWFADNGTLLGAVRHGGYIPWDDDLDIVMMRDELEHFMEVAPDELPDGYALLQVQTTEYDYLIAQVTNGFEIGFGGEKLERHCGCPYITGVDIFVLDGVFPDETKDAAQAEAIRDTGFVAGEVKAGGPLSDEANRLLRKLEREHGVTFKRGKTLYHELRAFQDKLSQACPVSESDTVAQMIFHPFNGSHTFPKEWYRDTVFLPFEGTTIRAPGGYDAILRADYGEYMNIYKGGSSHEYPVYANQEALLKQQNGCNTFRYTFRTEDLQVPHAGLRAERIAQMTELLGNVQARAQELLAAGNTEDAARMLQSVQGAVATLEALARNRREVVFLVVRPSWWDGIIKELWQTECDTPDTDVYVICVPWQETGINGLPGAIHDERELFPEELQVTAPGGYNIAVRQPDKIVTQFPYDGTHQAIRIPELYYTEHLRKMTDELVYVPYLSPDPPGKDDTIAPTALSVLVEQPAVVFSDRVVLPSEGMSQFYVDTMTALAGSQTRSMWEQKIQCFDGSLKPAGPGLSDDLPVLTVSSGPQKNPDRKKTILFFLSSSFVELHGGQAEQKMGDVLDTFEQHAEYIDVIWLKDENLSGSTWVSTLENRFMEKHTGSVYGQDRLGEAVDMADAYYGCRSVAAHLCRRRNVPVMIMNADVLS